jgi:hypothetical protein
VIKVGSGQSVNITYSPGWSNAVEKG